MHKRKQQRMLDNKIQLQAYKKMCLFVRNRFNDEKIRPDKVELKMMEVLKKIVESGWIITRKEIKQMVAFLELSLAMV